MNSGKSKKEKSQWFVGKDLENESRCVRDVDGHSLLILVLLLLQLRMRPMQPRRWRARAGGPELQSGVAAVGLWWLLLLPRSWLLLLLLHLHLLSLLRHSHLLRRARRGWSGRRTTVGGGDRGRVVRSHPLIVSSSSSAAIRLVAQG